MSTDHKRDSLPRRTMLSRLSAGAAACVAMFGAAPALARPAASSPAAPDATPAWQPARHPEDDWYDQTPAAKHRFFLDTTEPGAFGQAIAWSRNFLEASASGYGLKDADAAIIICARHRSTSFAFSDAMWAKYGAEFSARTNDFVDPKTSKIPTVNVYMTKGYGDALKNNDNTLDTLIQRGARLAVCGMATRRIATLISQKHNTTVDEVMKELSANLVPNARIVPAGIVAVSRAQEHGYTAATVP